MFIRTVTGVAVGADITVATADIAATAATMDTAGTAAGALAAELISAAATLAADAVN
jgi:hypothetical protein